MTATASAPISAACAASRLVSAVVCAPQWTISRPRSAARKTTAARSRSAVESRIPSPVVPQAKRPSAPRSTRKRTIGQIASSSIAAPPPVSGVTAATIRGGRSGMAGRVAAFPLWPRRRRARLPAKMAVAPLDLATIRRAPKVLLHDHLDGGLRPATLIELADEIGYTGLPTTDPGELASWFKPPPGDGGRSLVRDLEAFTHTVAVMQTADAIERIAAESVEDLAADGILYPHVRFAPEQHLREGLTLDEVVDAAVVGVQ